MTTRGAKSATPRRRSQAERSAASTEAMLRAAIDLIVEQGPRVSLMAIGQRAGFSHGLVMARFGSRSGLIEAVAGEVQRQFVVEVTEEVGECRGLAALAAMITSFCRQIERRSTASRAFYVLLGESLGLDAELRAAFTNADRLFRSYVKNFVTDAQKARQIRPDLDASSIAAFIVSSLRGLGMQYCVNPDGLNVAGIRAAMLDYVHGLPPPAQPCSPA